ncbi:MAG: FkbM family methyltransferase, partial [Planctomycetota bacterium]
MDAAGVTRQQLWASAPWIETRDKWHGHRLRLDLSDYFQRHAAFMGCYHEVHVLAVIRCALRPGEAVIDGGANTGLLSCHAAGWLGPEGRLDAFEPHPVLADQAEWQFERNGLHQVILHRVALGAEEGAGTLSQPDPGNCGSVTLFGSPHGIDYAMHEVGPTRTAALDTVLPDAGDTRPLLMKLDIEGSEARAIRGARKLIERRRPAILAEINTEMLDRAGDTPGDLHALLADRGYSAFAFRRAWFGGFFRLSLYELPAREVALERDVLWLTPDGPHW